jgi:hypothetical protein
MTAKIFSLSSLAVILLGLSLSCSTAGSILGSGPSDGDVKAAVQKTMTTEMTGGIPQAPLWGGREQVKIDSVNVLQRGNYNEAGKYYPVRVNLSGSYIQKAFPGSEAFGQPPQRNCTFTGSGNFRLSKSDYGEWVAQIAYDGEPSKDDKLTCDK